MKTLNEIFKAVNNALSEKGILIIRRSIFIKCLQNVAYDQFYCEHIYVFSTLALREILKNFDLEIFDIENTKTHGGSNRYYIKKKLIIFIKLVIVSKLKLKKN